MYLKNIQITDFRNFEQLDYHCGKGINCIIGDNGQGKTSIIEAIYYLATLRSMRKAGDRELIRHGRHQSIIRAEINNKDNDDTTCEVGIEINAHGGKKVKKDNKFVRSHKEYWGTLRGVVFSSIDMEIVRGTPSIRRDYLDSTLSMLDSEYTANLNDHTKCLTQKNALLKQLQNNYNEYQMAELELWNKKLAKLGHSIYLARADLAKTLSEAISGIYSDFFAKSDKASIRYLTQLEEMDEKQVYERLRLSTEKEIIVGHSLIGIHRDDMMISLSGHEAKIVASQGQQRIITIALKLAQINILRAKFGNNFILILDDVMAELDNIRQSIIYHIIPPDIQSFITTTHINDIELLRSKLDHIYSYSLRDNILTKM